MKNLSIVQESQDCEAERKNSIKRAQFEERSIVGLASPHRIVRLLSLIITSLTMSNSLWARNDDRIVRDDELETLHQRC